MKKQTDILDYTIKLLNNKIYFINELYKKLLNKYDRKEVNSAIKELIQKDYINDKKAASIYLYNLINYKMYGKKYVYSFFLSKGISENLIKYLLSSYNDEEFLSNKENIKRELIKKGKSDKYIYNYLLRKGYDIEE